MTEGGRCRGDATVCFQLIWIDLVCASKVIRVKEYQRNKDMFCFLYATLKCDRAWVVPPCSCSEGVAPFALRRSLKEPWPVKEVIWAWFCDLQIAF